MNLKIRNVGSKLLLVTATTVLIGKILSNFLHFDHKIDIALSTAMFCIIGISYLFIGISKKRRLVRYSYILAGIYLVGFNVLDRKEAFSIIGIGCLIIPFALSAIFSEKKTIKEVKRM